MLTIYLNLRFLTQRITGVQRFAFAMCQELDQLLVDQPKLNIIGLLPKRPLQIQYANYMFKKIKLRHCGFLTGHLWEQLELPWYSRNCLLLNWCNTAPLFKIQQWITIHDVIFMTNLDSQKWWFKLWYRCLAAVNSRVASIIFTVSEFSAHEIRRYFPHVLSKIIVLGNAPSLQNYAYANQALAKWSLSAKSFYLILGSNSVRKNTAMVANLFADQPELQTCKLVVVGGQFSNLGEVKTISRPNIIYTDYINDGELRTLVQQASALIYPSIYEGFGIPVVEAMSEDTLVLAADISVLHEVCGGGALYFDPYQPQQLLNLLQQLAAKQIDTALIKQQAQFKLANYSWRKFGLKVFTELCLLSD